MIFTIVRIGWIQLRRSPVDALVVFAVPIVFFSIFAVIFGGQSQNSTTSSVDLAVVDEDGSEYSRRFVQALENEAGLDVRIDDGGEPTAQMLDLEAATRMVREGVVPVAVILPAGLGESFPNFGGTAPGIRLLADPSDPIAPQIVGGLLQKVAMTAMPTSMVRSGAEQFQSAIGGLSDDQQENLDGWLAQLDVFLAAPPPGEATTAGGTGFGGFVNIQVENVLGDKESDNPIISFYAAAIAVMFLLFSASGAGGSLLEEEESQTLERLLSTQLSMSQLLLGKWIFLTTMGVANICIMFLWGWAMFDLDFFSHLPGFFVMTSSLVSK